MTKIVNFQKI